MRIQKGQLELDFDLYDWRDDLLEHGLVEIPINGVIAARAGLLADIHGDPADRLIVATALAGHRLVTSDERILAWGGNLDRMDARE
jgi:PIN domain nuclease of toxin-antitoxin system